MSRRNKHYVNLKHVKMRRCDNFRIKRAHKLHCSHEIKNKLLEKTLSERTVLSFTHLLSKPLFVIDLNTQLELYMCVHCAGYAIVLVESASVEKKMMVLDHRVYADHLLHSVPIDVCIYI
jgi:hypothetical protein